MIVVTDKNNTITLKCVREIFGIYENRARLNEQPAINPFVDW